jgi:hypothetical protein
MEGIQAFSSSTVASGCRATTALQQRAFSAPVSELGRLLADWSPVATPARWLPAAPRVSGDGPGSERLISLG